MEIGFFRGEELEKLRAITEQSFLLNSFNVDTHLPRLLRGELFFENMAKKAMQENSNSCLVARINGKPQGYIIHGVDKKLSAIFGMYTATIILFCVSQEARGKGVGEALLARSITLLRGKGVRLITVGTDANNEAAINLYQKVGFRTKMNWGTFRYYPNFEQPHRSESVSVVPYGGEKSFGRLARYTERPVAFFRERKIPRRALVELRSDIVSGLVHSVNKGEVGALVVKQEGFFKDRLVGMLTFEEEEKVQKFFNGHGSDKKIYRINDIVVASKQRNQGIGTAMLAEFIHSVKNYHFIEIWAAMDNWALLNVAAKAGFRLSHLATILHYSTTERKTII